jgi:hypothetical protein
MNFIRLLFRGPAATWTKSLRGDREVFEYPAQEMADSGGDDCIIRVTIERIRNDYKPEPDGAELAGVMEYA